METRTVKNSDHDKDSEQKEKSADLESNVSNKSNPIPQLTELAFKAFLRARKDFNFETTSIHDAIIEQQILKLALPFLQSIADANLDEVKKFLEDCPELVFLATGTVTTVSGYTYENVSAVELVYLMDDVEMANMMLPYIKELSEEKRKKADDQLAKKMAEVEKQRALFKPYDFTEIVKAISADQTLKDTGRPSPETKKMLAKFKEDFKPVDIKVGKSWLKEHLQEGFRVYDKNFDPWDVNQLRWYLINIIGHMETRAEKCFEQECSQGLKEIVDEKKPSRRTSTIKNYINDLPLTYRGSLDSSLLLGRDFFVEIYSGDGLDCPPLGWGWRGSLKIYVEQKNQAWKSLSSSLTSNNHHTNRL